MPLLHEQVIAGFNELASAVEANEPGCLSYQFFLNESSVDCSLNLTCLLKELW